MTFVYEQEVLWLEISMGNLLGVTVVERLKDLFEDPRSHFLTKVLGFHDPVEELSSCAQSKVKRKVCQQSMLLIS